MKAVGLLRVSHSSQIEGYSLDAQRRETARWCESRGYNVDFRSEEGVSAKTERLEKRPVLQAILASAERHDFDLLVVHTLDRLARNQGVQRRVLETLGKAGVGFATVIEGHEFITPTGKLIMSVMGAVNEFFSDQLGVHVSKAARQRVEIGLPVGPIPFGFRSLDPWSAPLLVAEEASALLEAFQQRERGESMGELAMSLNEQGFMTRGGKRFTAHAMRDILENPFYHGIVRHHGEAHPG